MRFSQAVSTSLVARGVLAVLAFSSSALAARILEPAMFGAVVTSLAAVALLMRILSLGVGQSAQYFGAVERGGGRSLRWPLLACTLILSLTAALTISLFLGPLAAVLTGDAPVTQKVFALLAVGVPLTLLGFLSSLYFLGRRQFGLYYASLLGPVLVLMGILIWTLLKGGGLNAVVDAYRIQFIVMALFALPMLWPLTIHLGGTRSFATDLGDIARYATKSYLIFVTSFAVSRLSIFLGAQLTTLDEVGYFGLARTLSEATFQFYGAIGPVLLSFIGASKDGATVAPLLALVSRLSFALYCSMALATMLAAWMFLGLIFGQAYLGALIPLCILLPGVVLNGIQHTLESYLYGTNRQGPVVFAHISGAIALTVTALVLVPRFGAIGLAAAATVSSVVAYAVTAGLIWRLDGLTPVDTLVLRPSDLKSLLATGRRLFHR